MTRHTEVKTKVVKDEVNGAEVAEAAEAAVAEAEANMPAFLKWKRKQLQKTSRAG